MLAIYRNKYDLLLWGSVCISFGGSPWIPLSSGNTSTPEKLSKYVDNAYLPDSTKFAIHNRLECLPGTKKAYIPQLIGESLMNDKQCFAIIKVVQQLTKRSRGRDLMFKVLRTCLIFLNLQE